MKATLEFDLSNDDDRAHYEHCLAANKMALAIDEVRDYLRQQRKYGNPPDDFDKIDEKICGILHEVPIE